MLKELNKLKEENEAKQVRISGLNEAIGIRQKNTKQIIADLKFELL